MFGHSLCVLLQFSTLKLHFFLGNFFVAMHFQFDLSFSFSCPPPSNLPYPTLLLCFLKSLSVFLLSPAVLHSCFSGEGGWTRKREGKKEEGGTWAPEKGGWGKRGKEGPFLYENAFCWECWEENPSMTKAVGPKHKPDLWKVRAQRVRYLAQLGSVHPPFSTSFLSFMITPSCLSPFPSSCLSTSFFFQSMLSVVGQLKTQKGLIKVLDSNERSREIVRHTIWGKAGSAVWSCGNEMGMFCCRVFFCHLRSEHRRFFKKGKEKRNRCSGKISSTCLRWKLVDLKRWRGAGGK